MASLYETLRQRIRYRLAARRARTNRSVLDGILLPLGVGKSPDRSGFAIVAIVKNEARYVTEWLAFYGCMGARHIYLYDNNSTDDLQAAISESGFAGIVTHIPWGDLHTRRQALAYQHCLSTYGDKYRWMGFFDIDEFVLPCKDETLSDALSRFDEQSCIAMPWFMFGTSGHERKPSGLVLEAYTQRKPFPYDGKSKVLCNCKIFVDPSVVVSMDVHEAYLSGVGSYLTNDIGMTFPSGLKKDPGMLTSEFFQLNHYYTRSREEFMSKLDRGHGAIAGKNRNATLEDRFEKIETNTVPDETALRFLPKVKKAMSCN